MGSKVRRIGIGVALTVVLLLGVVVLALSYSGVGETYEVGKEGLPLALSDLSVVPQSVVDDATRLATELFGDRQEDGNDFVNQLLATYLEAKDKDFVIVFNPGGWGCNLLEATPGWHSIVTGIESELASLDYELLLLNYRRTAETLRGRLDELVEMATLYPSKAKDLARRVEFLTEHIPDLRVIVTGESNGAIISDSVMNILRDNPQVYSIQTGSPFWHNNVTLDRTLDMTDNGIIPDSLSRGDFWAILKAYLKALFGLSQPVDDFDTIPHYVREPGHDYWWQYPKVYSEITDFLEQNFGIKW